MQMLLIAFYSWIRRFKLFLVEGDRVLPEVIIVNPPENCGVVSLKMLK